MNLVNKYGINEIKKIEKERLIEMLSRNGNPENKYDKVFKEHLLKLLAKRLKVRLRKKPLTMDQIMEIMDNRMKKFKIKDKKTKE